jgi:hypothetical protein
MCINHWRYFQWLITKLLVLTRVQQKLSKLKLSLKSIEDSCIIINLPSSLTTIHAIAARFLQTTLPHQMTFYSTSNIKVSYLSQVWRKVFWRAGPQKVTCGLSSNAFPKISNVKLFDQKIQDYGKSDGG